MRHIRSILTLLVLVAVLLVVLTFSGRRVLAPTTPNGVSTTTDATSSPVTEGITVADSYSDGTHTYAFDLFLPTPCHSLSLPDVQILESYPEQIRISYNIIPPKGGVMCAQVITSVPVSVEATASEGARLTSLSLAGSPITFTLVAR